MSVKIKQLEPQFAQRLGTPLRTILHEFRYSLPEHYQLQVSLLDANGRKKRSDASAENWSPESGRIEIRFQSVATLRGEPSSEGPRATQTVAAPSVQAERVSDNSRGSTVDVHPAEADLLKALDRAESTPGWSFVPLKKFRDEILPSEHSPSMPGGDVHYQSVLRSAIEKRLILVGKVPNPKAPQFPVTTIRLNRLMPEVRAALGQADNPDLDFHPVEISGEPLSATILRERR
jgi:hypothetical protein